MTVRTISDTEYGIEADAESWRLVKAVLHKAVAPAVNPDPRLLEDLAAAMGHITIHIHLHKGCPDLISNGKVSSAAIMFSGLQLVVCLCKSAIT